MRRVATEIGVTQPVLYSAFPDGRQAVIDAVAVGGFTDLAESLEAVEAEPAARLRAYLDFALGRPRLYEAMFSMPSGLRFGPGNDFAPLRRAFAAIQEAFPDAGDTEAEVVWATIHGLATLELSERLPAARSADRLRYALSILRPDEDSPVV
jgi:AcrR family transcriptional regulator